MKIIKNMVMPFFLLFFACAGKCAAHPFYVSICQIDYNEQNRSLEISVKVFADDLLLALGNRQIKNLHLGEKQENPKTDEYIFGYLKENLEIKAENKPVVFSYVGKEMEDDAVWCFLEAGGVGPFSKIEVANRILTEIYESQSNVVQVNNKHKIMNLLLRKGKPSGELNF